MRIELPVVLALALALPACGKHHEAPPPPPPPAHAPMRGATGDADLRVMLAEVAAAKACTLVKGQFRALRAPDRRDVATGILWIRTCRITNDGTQVTFHLGASGWQWAQ